MPAFLNHLRVTSLAGRRCAASLLLVAYAVTAAGVPLPTGHVVRKTDEMYPCAHCACGCASAEQCWRSCCCHTLAERMAWARANGVRPPDFAIAEARQARIEVSWLVRPVKACCARDLVAGTPKCCQAGKSCCGHKQSPEPAQNKEESKKVIGWKALNCQGHSSDWAAAAPTLISANVTMTERVALPVWMGPLSSEKATSVAAPPTPPPPQSA